MKAINELIRYEEDGNYYLADKAKLEVEDIKNVLLRWLVYEEFDGYEQLSKIYGVCEHPESSIYMEEWLDRVLRNPTKKLLNEV